MINRAAPIGEAQPASTNDSREGLPLRWCVRQAVLTAKRCSGQSHGRYAGERGERRDKDEEQEGTREGELPRREEERAVQKAAERPLRECQIVGLQD